MPCIPCTFLSLRTELLLAAVLELQIKISILISGLRKTLAIVNSPFYCQKKKDCYFTEFLLQKLKVVTGRKKFSEIH